MRLLRVLLFTFSTKVLKPFLDEYQKYQRFYRLNLIFKKVLIFIFQKIHKNRENSFFVIGRDYVNWSIDQDNKNARYFLNLNNFKINTFIFKSNYVLCVWYDILLQDNNLWIFFLKRVVKFKIIAFVTNDIRLYPMKVEKLRNFIDLWVSPSQKIYDFLIKNDLNVILIPFFISKKIFYPINKNKKFLCQKLKIDYNKVKDKLIIGSFQRDSRNTLDRPKEVKNPDLLIDILNKLDKTKYIFLIAGPRRHYIVNRCENLKIPYLYYGHFEYIENYIDDLLINNLPYKTINLLYNISGLYIISSKFEGGPKAVLEASLTKTLIFSTDVGLAKDFLHEDLIYSEDSIQDIINFIDNFEKYEKKINEYISLNYNKTRRILTEKNYQNYYKNLII